MSSNIHRCHNASKCQQEIKMPTPLQWIQYIVHKIVVLTGKKKKDQKKKKKGTHWIQLSFIIFEVKHQYFKFVRLRNWDNDEYTF